MECSHCKSGYPILMDKDAKFCGFCGASLHSIDFRLMFDDGPYYADETNTVTLTIVINNVGIGEFKIDGVHITMI